MSGENPKDAIAAKKPDLSLVPPALTIATSKAMEDGARKYGPYNWRDKKVRARVYVAAAQRHLLAWLDGEETATDSGAHHLGHAAACLGILLDAQAGGHLEDDRPKAGPAGRLLTTEAPTGPTASAPAPWTWRAFDKVVHESGAAVYKVGAYWKAYNRNGQYVCITDDFPKACRLAVHIT